jgi:hypothetical protein
MVLKWATEKVRIKKEGLLNVFYFFSFSRYFKSSRSFGRPAARFIGPERQLRRLSQIELYDLLTISVDFRYPRFLSIFFISSEVGLDRTGMGF